MDYAKAGLLEGLEGEERAGRVDLLQQLAAEGVPFEELRAAVAEDRLVLLPVERALGGRYTAQEVADRAGVSAQRTIAVWRALGFPDIKPDDAVFSEDDVQAAGSVKLFLEAGLSEEVILETTRVLGDEMARLASTITGGFADTFLHPGDTERDVALRFAAMAQALLPSMTPVLVAALGAHVRESARRGMIGRAERERGHLEAEEEAVVCFADLVGFTSLGGEIGARELGSLARQLAELAASVATAPVRLVKTIGDAAMFVSPDAPALVEAALALVQAVQDAELPSLRAGVASGPALLRAGDWYGHSVNVASRVTGVARPGSVLCTQEVRDAAMDGFEWSFAGRHRLKGVSEPPALHRARRLETAESPSPEVRPQPVRPKRSREGRSQRRAPR